VPLRSSASSAAYASAESRPCRVSVSSISVRRKRVPRRAHRWLLRRRAGRLPSDHSMGGAASPDVNLGQSEYPRLHRALADHSPGDRPRPGLRPLECGRDRVAPTAPYLIQRWVLFRHRNPSAPFDRSGEMVNAGCGRALVGREEGTIEVVDLGAPALWKLHRNRCLGENSRNGTARHCCLIEGNLACWVGKSRKDRSRYRVRAADR
jgi:hypothetical protein